MRFDDALSQVGELGRFQKPQALMLSLVFLCSSVQVMMTVFTLTVPDHRCAAPGVDNDTYMSSEVEGPHPLTSSPAEGGEGLGQTYRPLTCYIEYMDDRSVPKTSENITEDTQLGGSKVVTSEHLQTYFGLNSSTKRPCSRWVYDRAVFISTIATQMDFVCDRKLFKSHTVMALMVGQLVGSLVAGAADVLGRKKLMLVSLLFLFLSSVLTTWAGNITALGIAFFVNGLTLAAAYCCAFMLALEQVGPRWRHFVGVGCTSFWSLGMLWVCLLAYFLRDWRHLQLAASAPSFLFVLFIWLVPESPRWLAEKGRYSEAQEILERMARRNGKTPPFTFSLGEDKTREPVVKSQSVLTLVRCPPLLRRAAVVVLNWFGCALAYYGLSLNVGQLSGDIFLNFFLSALFELAAYASMALLLSRIGRKTLYCSTILLGGLACLLTVVPVLIGGPWTTWAVRILAMIGKFGVAGAFAIIWLYTPEVFPTSLRVGVTGICCCAGRLGGVAASYLANVSTGGQVGKLLPQILFGVMALLAGGLALTLPETSNVKMPDTVENAINMTRSTRRKPEPRETRQQESLLI